MQCLQEWLSKNSSLFDKSTQIGNSVIIRYGAIKLEWSMHNSLTKNADRKYIKGSKVLNGKHRNFAIQAKDGHIHNPIMGDVHSSIYY